MIIYRFAVDRLQGFIYFYAITSRLYLKSKRQQSKNSPVKLFKLKITSSARHVRYNLAFG